MKTVIVLGMHRSGTSMISGVLEKLGVDMVKRGLSKNVGNPLGYFEDEGFYNLNERILKIAGGSWYDVPDKDELEFIREKDSKIDLSVTNLIKNRESELWGFKDPRTCITIDFYLPHLKNPYFIVTHRNKEDIVKSFKKRDGTNEFGDEELVDTYRERIDSFFKEHPNLNRLDIDFEKAIDEPKKTVKRIAKFLKIKKNKDAINFIKKPEEIKKLREEMMIDLTAKYEERGAYHWQDYESNPFYKQHVDYVVDCLKGKSGLLLDVGCGDGLISSILTQWFDVWGVDISEKAIELAKEKNKVAHFQVKDVYDMAGGFDYLLASEVIEHLPDPDKFLKHIKGLFEKEALITTPNKTVRKTIDPHHFREYTKDELRELLRKHFDTVQIDKRGYNLYAHVK